MDASEFLLNIGLPVLIVLAVASRGFHVDDAYVATWANCASLQLTAERGPFVQRYLAWSRRCRTAGGILGFLAPVIYSEAVTREPLRDGGWSIGLMLVGYLLGALFAEATISRRARRSETATLVFHGLADYLPVYMVTLQRGLGIVSAVLAVVYPFLEPHARFTGPGVAEAAAWGIAGAGIAVVVEALQRTAIARRPPVTDDLAVDEAMRSSAMHVSAGTGIALLINVAGALIVLSILTVMPEPAAPPIGLSLFSLVFLSSLWFWLHHTRPDGFTVPGGEKQAVSS